jgi:hypothetical protein
VCAAFQVQIHFAVTGREFRADHAASPDGLLQPGIQMKMPDRLG